MPFGFDGFGWCTIIVVLRLMSSDTVFLFFLLGVLPSPLAFAQLDFHKKRKVWWKVERLAVAGREAKAAEKAAATELRVAKEADKPLQVL